MSNKDTVTVTIHLTDFPEDGDIELKTIAAGVNPFILIEPGEVDGDGDGDEYDFHVTNSTSSLTSSVAVLELVTESLKRQLEEEVES